MPGPDEPGAVGNELITTCSEVRSTRRRASPAPLRGARAESSLPCARIVAPAGRHRILTPLSWLLISAIQSRDYPLITGTVIVYTLAFVAINFMIDILYGVVDPRIRFEK